LVKRPFYTFFLTEGETFGINKLVNTTEGYLISDYITTRYLLFSQYEPKSNLLEVDTKNMTFLQKIIAVMLYLLENKKYIKDLLSYFHQKPVNLNISQIGVLPLTTIISIHLYGIL